MMEETFDQIDRHEAWKAGRAAAEEGRPETENPYEPGTEYWYTWGESYDAAMARRSIEEDQRRLREEDGMNLDADFGDDQ